VHLLKIVFGTGCHSAETEASISPERRAAGGLGYSMRQDAAHGRGMRGSAVCVKAEEATLPKGSFAQHDESALFYFSRDRPAGPFREFFTLRAFRHFLSNRAPPRIHIAPELKQLDGGTTVEDHRDDNTF
jgi:hypothetical protein